MALAPEGCLLPWAELCRLRAERPRLSLLMAPLSRTRGLSLLGALLLRTRRLSLLMAPLRRLRTSRGTPEASRGRLRRAVSRASLRCALLVARLSRQRIGSLLWTLSLLELEVAS